LVRSRLFAAANESAITLCLLLALCAGFSLLLVASYFPVTEGWFQDFSNYMSRGLLMYRDFYMFIPPGTPVLTHWISELTNNSFLALRLYGVAESLVLVAVTYTIARRLFSPRASFVAVLTAFVLSSANLQDVFYGYYQSALLLAACSLYLAIRCFENFEDDRVRYPILFGLTSGLLLLFKQSTGVLFPLAIGLTLLALTAATDRRRALRNAGASVLAYLVVVGVAAGMLAANRALQPALEQVLGGGSAKGGLGALLVGFLGHVPIVETGVAVATALGSAAFVRLSRARARTSPAGGLPVVTIISIAAAAMFFWIRFVPGRYLDVAAARDQRQSIVYAAFFLVAVVALYLAIELARGRRGDRPVRLLVSVAAFALMYLHGLSGVLEEHALLLPGTLLIGTALSAPVAWPTARDVAIDLACAALLFTVTVQRNAVPYNWWGVNSLPPTWEASSTFDDPHLAGIRSSPTYTRELNAIFELVEATKQPGDTLYSFPHINYFNVMADLPSPTFGRVDYFDVAPDSLAILDADLLRQHPPTFLVWMELTPAEWSTHEALFRGGRESGQREIRRVFDELVASGTYRELGRFRVGESDPIGIYILDRHS
jgi:Dolichyl-phosphate-mannose-protein mannosyltransferase